MEFCDIGDEEIPEKFKSGKWRRKKRNIVKYSEFSEDYIYREYTEIVNGERVLNV
jgi:hypothetical protein